MKSNPDDRSDNVEKIQRNIRSTILNMEAADDQMKKAENRTTQKDLKEKNKRRADALDAMRHEVKDEADYRDKR